MKESSTMSDLLDGKDEELAKLLCLRDREGRVALTIGLVATVFFERPWEQEQREAVADLAERYIAEFRDKLKWSQGPKNANWYRINSKRARFPGDWLRKYKTAEEGWEFAFHGGESDTEATPIEVSAMGGDTIQKGLGYFHVSFPLLWFTDRPITFPETLRAICERLKPISGYGGIGLIESPDISAQVPYHPLVRKIGERFPGLEIEEPPGHTNHVDQGIKGVNWLTVLSDQWIDKIGGRDYLRIRLDESFYFYPYDGGLIIQAGPKPQIGDVTTNRWPERYVTLAKVLKPIQIKEHYGMTLRDGGFDYASTLAWLFRFDGK
jgi:hypothetical protein